MGTAGYFRGTVGYGGVLQTTILLGTGGTGGYCRVLRGTAGDWGVLELE